jgi:ABC-type multidrug transport system fused ATPase/permease subunit
MGLLKLYIRGMKKIEGRKRVELILNMQAQIVVSVLDMIGVLLLGATTLIVISGTENQSRILRLIPNGLENFMALNPIILFVSSLILLSTKTILSFFLTKHLLYLTAKIQTFFGTEAFGKNLIPVSQSIKYRNDKKLSKLITDGSRAAASGIIAYLSLSISEFVLLVMLLIPLIVLMPQLMLVLFILIGVSSFYMQKLVGKFALSNGNAKSINEYTLRNHTNDINMLSKFLFVSKKYDSLIKTNSILSDSAAKANAKVHLAQQLPKYIMELNLILAMAVICTYFYLTSSIGQAIANVILIISISSRILPTLLRLQGALIFAKSNVLETEELFDFLENGALKRDAEIEREIIYQNCENRDCSHLPAIQFQNVSFGYPNSTNKIIDDLSFTVKSGEMLILNGKSGAGKTTIADLILGIIPPTKGSVKILCCNKCELKIGYMPQETHLVEGSVSENIAMGEIHISEKSIQNALELSGAKEFVGNLNESLNEKVGLGERPLSGGQKQRKGLARVLYLQPNLLVLDEPTSSLDLSSSNQLFETLTTFERRMTIVMIAHNTDKFYGSVKILKV